ncbi:hypothetical protein N9L72_00900 [Schleiferiaceae bacterium]|nr:hypothetical protein [Schleiferiaceae bacterium]
MIYKLNLFTGKDNLGNRLQVINTNTFENSGWFDAIDKNDRFIRVFRNWYLFGFYSGSWKIAKFVSKHSQGNRIVLKGCSLFTYRPITGSFGEVSKRYLVTNALLHKDIYDTLTKQGFEVKKRYSVFVTIASFLMYVFRNCISIVLVILVFLKYFLASIDVFRVINKHDYLALYKTNTQFINYRKTDFNLSYVYIDDKPLGNLRTKGLSSKNLIRGIDLAKSYVKLLREAGLLNAIKHDALYPVLRIAIYRKTIEVLNFVYSKNRVLSSEVLFPYNHTEQSKVDLLVMIELPKGEYFCCDEGIEKSYFLNKSIIDLLRANKVFVNSRSFILNLKHSDFVFNADSRFVGFFVQPILLDEEIEIIRDIVKLSNRKGKFVKLYLHPRSKKQDYACLKDAVLIADRNHRSELCKAYTRTSSIGVELEQYNLPVYYCLYGTLNQVPPGLGRNSHVINERSALI